MSMYRLANKTPIRPYDRATTNVQLNTPFPCQNEEYIYKRKVWIPIFQYFGKELMEVIGLASFTFLNRHLLHIHVGSAELDSIMSLTLRSLQTIEETAKLN